MMNVNDREPNIKEGWTNRQTVTEVLTNFQYTTSYPLAVEFPVFSTFKSNFASWNLWSFEVTCRSVQVGFMLCTIVEGLQTDYVKHTFNISSVVAVYCSIIASDRDRFSENIFIYIFDS